MSASSTVASLAGPRRATRCYSKDSGEIKVLKYNKDLEEEYELRPF